LVVEPNDLIVAFSGFFNPAEDGSGAITSWTNLEELAQIPNNAYAEGAWATGTVESSPLLRASSTKVGAESGTNANQAGVAAAVVKPKRKGNTLLDGISISISTAIGISQQSVDTVGTARGTSTVVGVTNPGVMTGTATGSSIVSGVSSSAIDIVGIASGTSTVVGVGASIADTAGTSTGTASVVAGIIGNTMLVTCIGRQATASVGEVSFVSSQSIIEVTGVEAVGQVGDVTLQLNSQFVVEGVEATGAVGQARIAGLVPEDVAPPERRAGVRAENNSASVGAEIRIMSVSAEQPYYALAA
jgi:hypothetical protein